MDSTVRDASGDVVFEESRTARVEADWYISHHFGQLGEPQAGSWAPGWYSTHVSVGGEEIASGWFQVSDLPHRISPEADQALLEALHWFDEAIDGSPDSTAQRARLALSSIWSHDEAAGDRVAGFGWVADTVSESELAVLQHLELLPSGEAEVASQVTEWPLVSSVIDSNGRSALRSLGVLSRGSPEDWRLSQRTRGWRTV